MELLSDAGSIPAASTIFKIAATLSRVNFPRGRFGFVLAAFASLLIALTGGFAVARFCPNPAHFYKISLCSPIPIIGSIDLAMPQTKLMPGILDRDITAKADYAFEYQYFANTPQGLIKAEHG
ncbi:MAG: hypothetical protein KAH38_11615 [Candidatus Hydrogenedentes bacterium]|nr:hypothetical protein [Candidatus Hydrogenedentota bacterium]